MSHYQNGQFVSNNSKKIIKTQKKVNYKINKRGVFKLSEFSQGA